MAERRGSWVVRIGLALAALAVMAIIALVAVPDMRWRTHVVAQRLSGRHAEAPWGDLLRMLAPRSGFWLQPLVQGQRLEFTVVNPLNSSADMARGRALFDHACAVCHGAGGGGTAAAPSLRRVDSPALASDWGVFKTVRHGVENTAMAPHPEIPFHDAWTLVGYVRSLAPQGGAPIGDVVGPSEGWGDPVSFAELKATRGPGKDWLIYGGDYTAARHSSLKEITPRNVAGLEVAWVRQFQIGERYMEVTPIVRGGAMYLTDASGHVTAVSARTGRVLWAFSRKVPDDVRLCCGRSNRGVAILGDRVYVGTLDAHLIALDRKTGRVDWDIEVADYRKGHAITSAPLALDGVIVTGVAGGDYGIRGFIDAYDAGTGARVWRTYTLPGAGEPGAETWPGDGYKTGGAATWVTGTYDVARNQLFWGTGNPAPDFARRVDGQTNLYSDSLLALDAKSGKVQWHFQFTPGDDRDWDSTQTPVLATLRDGAATRDAVLFANRNGFYYVFDRADGRYRLGRAYVEQTWTDGLDERGRPRTRDDAHPTIGGTVIRPAVSGSTNWWTPSYDAAQQLLLVPTLERATVYFTAADHYTPGEPFMAGTTQAVPGAPHFTAIRALDALTGERRWEYRFPNRTEWAVATGVTTTDGGIVLGGDWETAVALDASNGKLLWSLGLGGRIAAGPITYQSRDQQFVAYVAGSSVVALRLRGPHSTEPAAALSVKQAADAVGNREAGSEAGGFEPEKVH